MKSMFDKDVLVDLVKAAGRELIANAESYVGDTKEMTSMDIWARFRNECPPEIDISKTVCPMSTYPVLLEHFSKE